MLRSLRLSHAPCLAWIALTALSCKLGAKVAPPVAADMATAPTGSSPNEVTGVIDSNSQQTITLGHLDLAIASGSVAGATRITIRTYSLGLSADGVVIITDPMEVIISRDDGIMQKNDLLRPIRYRIRIPIAIADTKNLVVVLRVMDPATEEISNLLIPNADLLIETDTNGQMTVSFSSSDVILVVAAGLLESGPSDLRLGDGRIAMTGASGELRTLALSWQPPVSGEAPYEYSVYSSANPVSTESIEAVRAEATLVGSGISDVQIEVTNFDLSLTTSFYVIVKDALDRELLYVGKGSFCGGAGIQSNPFLVCDVGSLQNANLAPDKHYRQTADIDAPSTATWNGGKGFLPIGRTTDFTGSYDGNGFQISGLVINRPTESRVGIFSRVVNGSLIHIDLENINVTGDRDVGGLVGVGRNIDIKNIKARGVVVQGNEYTGGIVGNIWSDGSAPAEISFVDAEVTVTSGSKGGGLAGSTFDTHVYGIKIDANVTCTSGNGECGGVLGEYAYNGNSSRGSISSIGGRVVVDCSSLGLSAICVGVVAHADQHIENVDLEVQVTSSGAASGLSNRYAYGKIMRNVHLRGNVTGAVEVGGIFGHVSSGTTLVDSSFTGNITGTSSVGGIAGFIGHYLNGSRFFFDGSVSGNSAVGGVIGYDGGGWSSWGPSIRDCYVNASITGNSATGGFIGQSDRLATLGPCHFRGAINGSADVGGIIGQMNHTFADYVFTNLFWESGGANPSNGIGGGTAGSRTTSVGNFETATTSAMKQAATFTGHDFARTWEITENVTYPSLRTDRFVFSNQHVYNPTTPEQACAELTLPATLSWLPPDGRTGDFNGDGTADLLTLSGTVAIIYSGTDGAELARSSSWALTSQNITNAAWIDFNGDAFMDLVLVDKNYSFGGLTARGLIQVVSGSTGAVLRSIMGPTASTGFANVQPAGDFNGDGTPDIAVGSPQHNGGGNWEGRIYVFSGTDGATLLSADGEFQNGGMGASIIGVGDVNGDGRSDVMTTAREGWNVGGRLKVYIYSGATGTLLTSHWAPDYYDGFGTRFGTVGDINADARSDYFISAPDALGYGRVYVYSGADQSLLHTLQGTQLGEGFGAQVVAIGDFNGDGKNDFAVGSPNYDTSEGIDRGRVTILSGANFSVLKTIDGSRKYGGLNFGSKIFPSPITCSGNGTADIMGFFGTNKGSVFSD